MPTRPDRRPPRPTGGPEELAGFLAGVEHRLSERRRAGSPEPRWEATVARARACADAGDWEEAERILHRVDRHLRETQPEERLREFPRGLVGYVPDGDPGEPTPEEEDSLFNRVALAGRLLDVRRASGFDVSRPTARLREAEAALRSGDRRRAREECDAVFGYLERLGEGHQQD